MKNDTLGINMTWGTERYVLTNKLTGRLIIIIAVKRPRNAHNVQTHAPTTGKMEYPT